MRAELRAYLDAAVAEGARSIPLPEREWDEAARYLMAAHLIGPILAAEGNEDEDEVDVSAVTEIRWRGVRVVVDFGDRASAIIGPAGVVARRQVTS